MGGGVGMRSAVTRLMPAAVAAVVAVSACGCGPGTVQRSAPSLSAAAFLGSIGVGVHFNYIDTAYARQAVVLARLGELGVEHIREGVPFHAPVLVRGLQGASGLGLDATLGTSLTIPPDPGVAGGLQATRRRVDAFEGPNELDRSGPPDWRQRLGPYLLALRASMRARHAGVPLIGPSFVDPAHYRSVNPSSYDVVNLHPYPAGLPPEQPLSDQIRLARRLAPGRPVVITETGYHNALAARSGQPPVSEAAAAVYLPRAFLWSFASGVERTFVYELVDEKPDPALLDPEQHFGLVRNDLSPKPAFYALRNLIRTVRHSPGAAPGGAPRASVRSDQPLERVDLVRGDGSRVLALWRPVSVWDRLHRTAVDPGTAAVTVSWPYPTRDLTVTRPSASSAPAATLGAARHIRLELGGDVVLLSYR